MRHRFIFAALSLVCAFLLNSCGGPSDSAELSGNPALNGLPPVPQVFTGPGMPAAQPDDFEIVGDELKGTSTVYRKFFLDTVNQHSGGRWQVSNNAGTKQFYLSNTSYSAPKAWIMGGNYFNSENDDLYTNGWTTPDNTDGLRLSFYSRWKIASGDSADVYYWDGTQWLPVTSFSGGQNPDYPGWTKYYYELPAQNSGTDQTTTLNFHFQSNASGNDWGFGLDSVAVYQTQLNAPLNVSATDGTVFEAVDVTWTHNNAGTLVPDGYYIYEGTAPGGPYTFLWAEPYPATSTNVLQAPFDTTTYYYVVKAYKAGWPDSPESNEDSGFAGT